MAATTVMRDYSFTKKTALNMLKNIRNAMAFKNHKELEGVIEVDEYYEGGSIKNKHNIIMKKDFNKVISENRDDFLSDFAKLMEKIYYSNDKNNNKN